ncbi:unnamed protein product [Ectocarpus sp. 8 AP-2014]
MTEQLSKLEGLAAGGNDGHTLLQQHQKEMLAKLREIRAAMATETGELDSVKEANAEVAKLREVLKRRDYRILHLTRALEAGASSSADPTSA